MYQTVKKGGWHGSEKRYAYFLIGLSGCVWYLVLANHTREHHFFTYRIWSVSLLAFLALVLDSVSWEAEKGMVSPRPRFGSCIMLGGVVLMAFFTTLLARERLNVLNGTHEFRQIEMEAEGTIEVAFVPTFNEIKNIGLGLETSGTAGEYLLTVWDADERKCQAVIPIADGAGKHFLGTAVDWKLEHGKTYRLTVEARGNREPVYVWVTQDGNMPLIEYGELQIEGRAVGGQLLTEIVYWCLPVSKKRLLFLLGSWTGVFMAFLAAVRADA